MAKQKTKPKTQSAPKAPRQQPNIWYGNFPKDYAPSISESNKYHKIWDALPNYRAHEKALKTLFHETYPLNIELSHILIKASALNDFYSTSIYDIYPICLKIENIKHFDDRLVAGDTTLVDEIAQLTADDLKLPGSYLNINSGNLTEEFADLIDSTRLQQDIANGKHIGLFNNNYSFATKYCSHHQPDKFPIYDKFVAKVLEKLIKFHPDVFKNLKKQNGGKINLRNYAVFKEVIDVVITHFGLNATGRYTYKDFDRYIWQLGKRYFAKHAPTYYNINYQTTL
jgi:hypothetical protein